MKSEPSSSWKWDAEDTSVPWDYFDRLRERHVPSSAPPSAVYRVPSRIDPDGDGLDERGFGGVDGYYDLRHLTNINALVVAGGVRQTFVEAEAAALLALHHFNRGINDVVPEVKDVAERCNTRFTIDFIDSMYSPFEASRAFLKDVLARGGDPHQSRPHDALPVPTALIGASRSAVSMPLATLGGVHGVPQFSAVSTSTALDNRDQFPLFGRIVPSAEADAAAVANFFAVELGITHFGVLHIKDSYGTTYAQALNRAAHRAGLRVQTASIPESSADPDVRRVAIREAVGQLKRSGLRYFFGIFFIGDYEVIMGEAYSAGIAGEKNFWVFGDCLVDLGDALFNAVSQDDLIKSSTGSALLAWANPTLLRGEDGYEAFRRHWNGLRRQDSEGRRYFDSKVKALFERVEGGEEMLRGFQFSEDPPAKAILTYTTALAAAIAVCDASAALDTANTGKDILSASVETAPVFQSPGKEVDQAPAAITGEDIFNAFLNVTFQGLYGHVSIDPATGSGRPQNIRYSVSNLLPDPIDESGQVRMRLHPSLVVQGSRDGQNGQGQVWRTVRPIVFPDGTTQAPPPLPPLDHDYNLISPGTLAAGYALCAFAILTSLVCSVWTFQHRECRIVKAAQPVFLLILTIGTFLMGLAIIPMSIQEPTSKDGLDAACMATPWLVTMGFSLTFSSLFAKEIRIAKVMKKDMRRVRVTAAQVMKPASVLVGLNALIMAVWTGVAPFKYERHDIEGSVDVFFGRPTQSQGMCVLQPHPDDPDKTWWAGMFFLVLIIATNLSALFMALYKAYQTRGIETEYSESKFIALSMVSIIQAWLIGMPLAVLGHSSGREAMFIVMSILIFLVCQTILLLIFVPKVYFLREWRMEQERRIKEAERKRQTPAWARQDATGGTADINNRPTQLIKQPLTSSGNSQSNSIEIAGRQEGPNVDNVQDEHRFGSASSTGSPFVNKGSSLRSVESSTSVATGELQAEFRKARAITSFR